MLKDDLNQRRPASRSRQRGGFGARKPNYGTKMTDLTTPNTPANGGQILTDERIAEIADATGMMAKNDVLSRLDGGLFCIDFARAIEADLRASLAAPAIPTVDRNANIEVDGWDYPTTYADLEWLTAGQLWNRYVRGKPYPDAKAAFLIARAIPFVGKSADPASAPEDDPRDDLIARLRKQVDDAVGRLSDLESRHGPAAGIAQPAAQVALTEDEQLALMSTVEDYMAAVDWAGKQTHTKCDAAEAAIFAKVNEFISRRATPATVKTAEKSDIQS